MSAGNISMSAQIIGNIDCLKRKLAQVKATATSINNTEAELEVKVIQRDIRQATSQVLGGGPKQPGGLGDLARRFGTSSGVDPTGHSVEFIIDAG